MDAAKHLILPATLSYIGVRASAMLGATSALAQIAAGIAGAFAGLMIAKHV